MFINPNAESQSNTGRIDKKRQDEKLTRAERIKRIATRNGISPNQAKKVQDLHDKFYEV